MSFDWYSFLVVNIYRMISAFERHRRGLINISLSARIPKRPPLPGTEEGHSAGPGVLQAGPQEDTGGGRGTTAPTHQGADPGADGPHGRLQLALPVLQQVRTGQEVRRVHAGPVRRDAGRPGQGGVPDAPLRPDSHAHRALARRDNGGVQPDGGRGGSGCGAGRCRRG